MAKGRCPMRRAGVWAPAPQDVAARGCWSGCCSTAIREFPVNSSGWRRSSLENSVSCFRSLRTGGISHVQLPNRVQRFPAGALLEALAGCILLEETSQCCFCFFFRSVLQTVFDSK